MKIIEVENLSCAYPDGIQALAGITFSLDENISCGLMGPNGAGKTTLLYSLCGLLKTAGAIKIQGRALNNGNLAELRKHIGFLFQNPDDQLFMPTVAEDVAFGPINAGLDKETIPALVKESLKTVDIEGFESRSSHHLSVGEKKRVALAAVLVGKPGILILDEPTASLDPRGRREFIEQINGIPATKIIASHDLDMIGKLTQSVIVLNHGRITARGQTSDILSNNDLLRTNGLL
jgi:cobalt/nickel transport system ATP-binding protein